MECLAVTSETAPTPRALVVYATAGARCCRRGRGERPADNPRGGVGRPVHTGGMDELDTDAADMIAFYRARLDEDAEAARAATWDDGQSATWTDRPPRASYERHTVVDFCDDGVVVVTPENADADGVGQHVARHDPARALREAETHRAIVDAYLPPGGDPHSGLPCTGSVALDPDGVAYAEDAAEPWGETWCERHVEASKRLIHHDYVIRLLVAVHSDHPDYKDVWRP